jgi:archaellum component FlaF (FlaF/FlaG flagellin family)
MGIASPAVVTLLMAFAISAGGQVATAVLRTQATMSQAARDQGEQVAARAMGQIQMHNRTWLGGGVLEVRVNNTGGQPFDVNLVDALGDGAWISNKTTARTIDGDATRVWAPGEQLLLRFGSLSGNPARVWIVTESGAAAVG